MVFGPSGGDHDSPNHLYLILGTPAYFKKYNKIPNHFREIFFLEISNVGKSTTLKVLEKTRADKS